MEAVILILTLGVTGLCSVKYLMKTIRPGATCGSCPSSKGGCSKTLSAVNK